MRRTVDAGGWLDALNGVMKEGLPPSSVGQSHQALTWLAMRLREPESDLCGKNRSTREIFNQAGHAQARFGGTNEPLMTVKADSQTASSWLTIGKSVHACNNARRFLQRRAAEARGAFLHASVAVRGVRFRHLRRPKVSELTSVVCRYASAPALEARVPAQRGERRVGIQGIDVQQ